MGSLSYEKLAATLRHRHAEAPSWTVDLVRVVDPSTSEGRPGAMPRGAFAY